MEGRKLVVFDEGRVDRGGGRMNDKSEGLSGDIPRERRRKRLAKSGYGHFRSVSTDGLPNSRGDLTSSSS